MSNDKFDEEKLKIILVGESGVGKTNLINVSTGGYFNEDEESTLSSSYQPKKIEINGNTYNLSIWDTIGQEKLRNLTKLFFKNSKIAILVYDITNKKSFKELGFWYNSLNEMVKEDVVLGVVGNKQDLYQKEEVSEEDGENYARSIKAKFKLTSAKEDPEGFNNFLKELLTDYINNNHEVGEKNIVINNKKHINKTGKKKCNC